MATKKTTTKKTPTKKATTVKKPVSKSKATAKSRASKLHRLKAHVGLRREEEAFFTFRITRQTLYWLFLGAVIILFTVWIMQLERDIQALYDQIDASTNELNQM